MASRVLNPKQEEYPSLGAKPVNPKKDARNNLSSSNPPQSTAKTSFSRRNGQQNKGPNLYGQRVNGPQQGKPNWSGYGKRLNIQRERTPQVKPNPMNATQTQRDENPENNDTSFLQWTVSAYKEILRDNCHLLNVSSKFRPPVIMKFDANVPLEDNKDHGIIDILDEWNSEYEHAQKMLNICRSQLRLWLMKQYVIKNSDNQDVLQHYNLDFKNFKTISEQRKKSFINPVKWFKKKTEDQSSLTYAPMKFYIMSIYSEEREFLKNIIQKFIELVEENLKSDDGDDDEIAKLNLLKFNFDKSDVLKWTEFYKNMKPRQNRTQSTSQDWPKLPAECYFQNSKPPDEHIMINGTLTLEESKRNEVLDMFKVFKSKYNTWVDTVDIEKNRSKYRQSENALRIWFHTRAWNAFRKAIQSNLIKQEDRDDYMKKNRIESGENKYLVLGSTMALALPTASRPSYLVSFERS